MIVFVMLILRLCIVSGEASDDTQAVDGGEGGSDVGSSSEEEGEAEEAMEH